MEKIVNLTPHQVVLRDVHGADLVLEPDPAGPARVSCTPGQQLESWCPYCAVSPHGPDFACHLCGGNGKYGDTLAGAALHAAPVYGEVENLPPEEEKTYYIVSMLAAQNAVGRRDVFYPGTGPADGAIRDDEGRVVAVTRLIQAPKVQQQTSACPKGCDCGI